MRHDRNKGRLEARRTGIERAEGEFMLFLDADDEILPDMATTLLEAQGGTFDIVQCGFEMRYLHYVSREDKRFNDEFNQPPAIQCEGDDVTHVIFRDRRTTWSLCGKLMRASIVKEAIRRVPESSLTQAEDACIFFLASYFAQSYKGLPGYRGYIYNIDLGHSDARWKSMNLEQFEYSCGYANSMNIIRAFIEETGCADALMEDYRTVRYEHVRAVADKLIRYVDRDERPAAYDKLIAAWDACEAVAGMCEAGWDDPAACLESVSNAKSLRCRPREVKTVAAYHYRMQVGGAERVTADLLRLWHERGYRTVMFADEPREMCAYELPDDTVWVELPNAGAMRRGEYEKRANAIGEAVEKYHIDALVHHQWWSPVLAWDLMLFKTLGVPVCVVCHNIYMALFYEPNVREFDHSRIMRHADELVVLSEFDRRFWDEFNPRVRCTVNPMTTEPIPEGRSKRDGKNIVWVGRLSSFDKQPQEALEIMARVIGYDPECTLTLVGSAPTKRDLASLKLRARQLGIADHVEFAGTQLDTAPYYQRASVHLLTSRLDGWCLVLAESKAHGLPCVMYEMPYLTLAQDERGIMAVPQGDRDAAARAIVQLLADEQLRERMGDEAFEHITELAGIDRGAFWSEVFADLAAGSPARDGFDDFDAHWDILLSGFKTSIGKALDLSVPSYVKRKGVKIAREAWHALRYR